MSEDEKIQAFLQLLVCQRKNEMALVKNFLIQYNPDEDSIAELKLMMEDQNILLENEAFDFLDKWREYKRCLASSIKIQQQESMKNNFDLIMAKNFPGGIK